MKKIRLERLNDGKPAIWETCGKRVTVICDNAGRYIYPFYITNTKSKNYIFLIPVKKDDIVVILYSSKYGSLIIEVFQIINFCKENKKEYALLRKISYYKEGKTNNEGILVKYIKSILTAISIFYENKRGKNERIKKN